jgi:WD40 repeat protein
MRLWEVRTGRCIQVYEGHKDSVFSVALSADGEFAFSGSADKTHKLWKVATGQCLGTSAVRTQPISAVALSLDGRWLLSGGEENLLQLYELEWELEARTPADWDEGARPILQAFLSAHVPYQGKLRPDRDFSNEKLLQALTRRGRPVWNEQDFSLLLQHLQYTGYGWLRPAGVYAKLQEMTRAIA